MIVLNLTCPNGHAFEGWFTSRQDFDDQCVRRLVQCTHCASDAVSALPSGPRVLRHAGEGQAGASSASPVCSAPSAQMSVQTPAPAMAEQLLKALVTMARQAENVGERFPEEARRIHYDEAPARIIRGIASREETEELLEEGILVLPAPVPPEGDLH